MQIYKRNQGKTIRVTTAVAMILLSAWGAYALKETLRGKDVGVYISYIIPAIVFALLCVATYFLTNKPKPADFLIATEGEMKKVAWSIKAEIFGSTKVVIIATFILAALLFMVDLGFRSGFIAMGVLEKN